jgi:HK97 family phage prohead protease
MKMIRAYSTLEIKGIDDDRRVIEGLASTPSVDRMGDIVEPKGAVFKLPMPFLWQHDSTQPIGQVMAATVTEAGIAITAQIAKGVLPRIDEAWALIKSGLVRGLSIGFQPLEARPIKGTSGFRFDSWSWLELSAVTIPANEAATVLTVKQFDARTRAAFGQPTRKGVRLLTSSPGASGKIAAHPGAVLLNRRS